MPDLLRRRRCLQEVEAVITSKQIELGLLQAAAERDFAQCGNPSADIAALRATEEHLAVLCIERQRLLVEERGWTEAWP
jgi:hypothetical protein